MNSLSRFRNRLVVAYPLVTYVFALILLSRACFLLFPQHTPAILTRFLGRIAIQIEDMVAKLPK
jgi:hypothetical protein